MTTICPGIWKESALDRVWIRSRLCNLLVDELTKIHDDCCKVLRKISWLGFSPTALVGEIVGIVLHEDEPPIGHEPMVKLKHLPAYLLIKLSNNQTWWIGRLCDPCGTSVNHLSHENDHQTSKTVQRTIRIHRLSFPGPDHYPCVGRHSSSTPVHSVCSMNFNELQSLRCVMFKKSHDPELLHEGERLAQLDRETGGWYRRTALNWEYQHTSNLNSIRSLLLM